MRSIKFSIIFLIGFYSTLTAQLRLGKTYGYNVGFVYGIGTHTHRFGVSLQAYGVYHFAQVNASIRLYDNFKDLGPKGEHAEMNAALGLCLGYGNKLKERNWFVSSISNQTGYSNSVAYSYNIWRNKIKTSQVTGIIALQFKQFSIICENDLLAKPMLDRFRTGAFLLQYQNKFIQYALNCTMWTGQMGGTIRNDSLFPHNGYMSGADGTYSNISHGLLSAQIKYANPYGQYLQANAGIDAEQVRNVMQNRIIHDMPFIPKKWNKAQNVDVPMIDDKGEQYLYKNGQKIRKSKLYLNGYISPNIFY